MQGLRLTATAFATLLICSGARAQIAARLESGACAEARAGRLASSATLLRHQGKIFAVASFNGALPANHPAACHSARLPDGRVVPLRWVASRWDLGLSILRPADEASLQGEAKLAADAKLGRGNPPAQLSLIGSPGAGAGAAEVVAQTMSRASPRHFFASIESVYEANPVRALPREMAGGWAQAADGAVWGFVSNQTIVQTTAAAARTVRLSLSTAGPKTTRPEPAPQEMTFQTVVVIPARVAQAFLSDVAAGMTGQAGLGRVGVEDVAQGREAVRLAGLTFEAACPDRTRLARPGEEFPIGGRSGNGFGIGGDSGNPNCRIDVGLAPGEGGESLADALPGASWTAEREGLFRELKAVRESRAPNLALWFSYELEPALKPFGLRDVGDFFQQLAIPERAFVYDSPLRDPILASEAPDVHRRAQQLIEAFLAFESFAKTSEPYVFGRILRSPGWSSLRSKDMDEFLRNTRADASLYLDILVAAERAYDAYVRAKRTQQ